MRGVREALQRNDLEEARARLADAGRGTGDLLFALEDGLLLHYAGDPELSNARFEFAERKVDDLYTKSITRAAFSLVTSDLILKFEPGGVENFMVNYYRALNYLQLGDPTEAWIEWRKLNSKLQFSRRQGDARYLDPPFFNHLAGLGLEGDDPNEAYVSMRLAEEGYRDRGERPPPDLVDDLIRLAEALGFADHLDTYRARYGGTGTERARTVFNRGYDGQADGERVGEIVVLLEDGLVAPIEEVKVYIPITERRAASLEEARLDQRMDLAWRMAREYQAGRYRGVDSRHAGTREVAYVLPLSFPVFGPGYPAFERAEVVAGPATETTRVGLNVTALQRAAFEDRQLATYAKTIARALVKWAAAAALEKEAEEEGGETAGDIVGFLANAVNVATERADTRAWLGLPHRIWIARLRVPPGRHELQVRIAGLGNMALGPVDVGSRERVFVSYRVF